MSQSQSEELIQNVIRKHGESAEAPAREVAQAYEEEIRRMEKEVEREAREVERELSKRETARARQDERVANEIRTSVYSTGLGGISLGIVLALFAIFEFGLSDMQVLIGAGIFGIGGLVLNYV